MNLKLKKYNQYNTRLMKAEEREACKLLQQWQDWDNSSGALMEQLNEMRDKRDEILSNINLD